MVAALFRVWSRQNGLVACEQASTSETRTVRTAQSPVGLGGVVERVTQNALILPAQVDRDLTIQRLGHDSRGWSNQPAAQGTPLIVSRGMAPNENLGCNLSARAELG